MSNEAPNAALPPTSRAIGFMRTGLIVVGVASVAALVLAATSLSRVSGLERQVADLQQSQEQLRSALSASGSSGDSVADAIKALQSDVEDAQQAADDANSAAEDASNAVDDLTQCVNTYMKVVGDAGGGRYRYRFC